jgi:MT-A70/ParB/Sulfiredoxin domain
VAKEKPGGSRRAIQPGGNAIKGHAAGSKREAGNPQAAALRAIEQITVGERFRRELGNLAGLADSIADVGLLHPVVIAPDGRLIAGARRLAAAKALGWTRVPVTIVNLGAIVRGEFAENAHRKDFTPSELVAIGQEVERVEGAQAKARKAHGGRPGKLPERQTGDARDKIAAQLGISGRTFEKARAVVEAADAEPERFGKLLADMDRTGRVNGPFKRLKVIRQAAEIRKEPPPLPNRGPKDKSNWGHWLYGQTEHAIVAVRGKPIVTLSNQTTLLHAPARAHSQKPIEFYDLVESLCPASRYCDLFSRYRHNDKWDCHGDEAPTSAATPPAPEPEAAP